MREVSNSLIKIRQISKNSQTLQFCFDSEKKSLFRRLPSKFTGDIFYPEQVQDCDFSTYFLLVFSLMCSKRAGKNQEQSEKILWSLKLAQILKKNVFLTSPLG